MRSVPNILSAYRLVTFPVVLYFALSGYEKVYFILILIDLVTDILDGLIARTFKLETEFGARLDAFADIGMYLLAFVGIVVFKANLLEPYLVPLVIFFGAYLLPKAVGLIKFRRIPSLHLISSKVCGYIQGIFFFTLFAFGFSVGYFYFMIITGILSFLEQTAVVLVANDLKSNMKGLYRQLKRR